MTLEQIKHLPDEVLTCSQVAPILRLNPTTLHDCCIERPELIGFPVIVTGRRVRIPRRPFVRFMEECVSP